MAPMCLVMAPGGAIVFDTVEPDDSTVASPDRGVSRVTQQCAFWENSMSMLTVCDIACH